MVLKPTGVVECSVNAPLTPYAIWPRIGIRFLADGVFVFTTVSNHWLRRNNYTPLDIIRDIHQYVGWDGWEWTREQDKALRAVELVGFMPWEPRLDASTD